jgi:hypothetical protein
MNKSAITNDPIKINNGTIGVKNTPTVVNKANSLSFM